MSAMMIAFRFVSSSGLWLQCKDVRLPGSQIEEQPASLQVVAVPLVPGRAELILQLPCPSGNIRKRQADMTLAVVGGIVYNDHERISPWVLPGERHEAVVGPVAVPGRCAFEKLPIAVAHGRLLENG